MWRLQPSVLLAAIWTVLATLIVRSRLRKDGVRAKAPRAPVLARGAHRGFDGAIVRFSPICIERSLVAQSWHVRHGTARDVVVGVPALGMGTGPAHAWVEGDRSQSVEEYIEIYRIPPVAPKLQNGLIRTFLG